ncbi:hypothetical protein LX64_01633 [Chitinophaga skermanii]|uniref:Uncharacterized protein n=1 Tax=Chitinophaga skermanii TaxID=331697 RepID=A0A327QPF0_9BACT|nr:hypothetical protein [Chitinophaga skermanii]RAJ06506.1 hypothetical protein LX64_01633 [Chitinophaga skermanii]
MSNGNNEADIKPAEKPKAKCNPPANSQFEQLKKAYADKVKVEIQSAQSSHDSLAKKLEQADDTACNERKITRAFIKAVDEYSFLNNCIAVSTSKDVVGIADLLSKTIVVKGGEMTSRYGKAVDAIKNAKKKVNNVNLYSEQLDDAIADSSNSEELKVIREILKKTGAPIIEDASAAFVTSVDGIVNQADDVAQSAVKVAGINEFINIDSLTQLSKTITEDATKFVSDVDKKLKDVQKKLEDSRKVLSTALVSLSTANSTKDTATDYLEAVNKIGTYLKDLNCDNVSCKDLDQIAKDAEASFNNDEEVSENPSQNKQQ